MTDLENKYLSVLSNIKNEQDLTDSSIQFIHDELNVNDFTIMHHRTHPQPYEIIYSGKNEINLNEIQKDILKSVDEHFFVNKIKTNKYNFFFFDSILATGNGNFYLSDHPIKNNIESILKLWNRQENITQKVVCNKEIQINEQQAGLTSQLMHDIQAIINLTSSVEKSHQLFQRIEYQKKVNKNYLFWLRKCELMKTNVALKELLESSLQIAEIESSIVDLDIPANCIDISVDVELFAMAFNEIVQNAIEAVEKNLSKIKIGVSQCSFVSPFFKKNWTIIQVEDRGSGIKEDFIPLVMNPFFTTKKENGFSGFGLANAKKIIEAHQGCIELKSTPGIGTNVIIMIPG
jgi:hypothetical protein